MAKLLPITALLLMPWSAAAAESLNARRKLIVVLALFLATGLTGCGISVPRTKRPSKPTLPLSARPKNGAGLSEADIDRAVKLCTAKCMRCHQLYDPAPYPEAEWQSWTEKMTKKAHLKPEQADLLWRYLGGFRVQ